LRLADFIATNTEPILAEWVAFAESCGPAGSTMDLTALRDHALAMLGDIVADLRTPQTPAEQSEKSKGNADSAPDEADTAAEVHGAGRAESGFTVSEMVSEYRALRASVLRLWTTACGSLSKADLEDMMRFNEAIDQSLAESVGRYTKDIDRSKEMFVAILGHDLRTPLGAIIMASQFMLDTGELEEPHRMLTTRIGSSARRMSQMVGDLLDFTRGRLGSGVPIVRHDMDLGTVVRQAVDEMSSAHPASLLQFTATGDLRGQWDEARIGQVMSNLLGNAVQHGDPKTTISVTAQGEATDVVVRVQNRGPAIPSADLPGLFSPFKRLGPGQGTPGALSSLGLGLYIAERIVTAHEGTIDVRSSAEAGTLFTVRLPRQ
jgi:signal transduction histidine kinase